MDERLERSVDNIRELNRTRAIIPSVTVVAGKTKCETTCRSSPSFNRQSFVPTTIPRRNLFYRQTVSAADLSCDDCNAFDLGVRNIIRLVYSPRPRGERTRADVYKRFIFIFFSPLFPLESQSSRYALNVW